MVVIYFLLYLALICVLVVILPVLWAMRMVFLAFQWIFNKMQGKVNEYVIEVQLATGPDSFQWFELGNARPSLSQARAALQACRTIDRYGECVMRIRVGEYPLIVVCPEDPPLVELR